VHSQDDKASMLRFGAINNLLKLHPTFQLKGWLIPVGVFIVYDTLDALTVIVRKSFSYSFIVFRNDRE
jgi:hypothetical protein